MLLESGVEVDEALRDAALLCERLRCETMLM